MNIFSKKKRRNVRRVINPEQEERKAEAKRKKFIANEYIEMAKGDPELKRQMIAKEFHLELPDKDPTKEQKTEILTIIDKEALKEIQDNPTLRKELATKRVSEILGESPDGRGLGEDGGGYRGSAIAEALDEIENFEELRNKLGGNKGSSWADVFKDPSVAVSLLGFLKSAMGSVQTQQGAQPARVYVVEVDGVTTELSEGEYGRYIQERRQPALDKAVSEEPQSLEGEMEESIESTIGELPFDIDKIIPFADTVMDAMDKEPDEFAINLIENASGDDTNSKALLNFLSKTTYDQICEIILPYKSNSKLSEYVQKVIDKRDWVESVIEQLKALGIQYQEA